MNSTPQVIRVSGRALPERRTAVFRLLDVQVRAAPPPASGARRAATDWLDVAAEEPTPLDHASLQPAASAGRQLYFL